MHGQSPSLLIQTLTELENTDAWYFTEGKKKKTQTRTILIGYACCVYTNRMYSVV